MKRKYDIAFQDKGDEIDAAWRIILHDNSRRDGFALTLTRARRVSRKFKSIIDELHFYYLNGRFFNALMKEIPRKNFSFVGNFGLSCTGLKGLGESLTVNFAFDVELGGPMTCPVSICTSREYYEEMGLCPDFHDDDTEVHTVVFVLYHILGGKRRPMAHINIDGDYLLMSKQKAYDGEYLPIGYPENRKTPVDTMLDLSAICSLGRSCWKFTFDDVWSELEFRNIAVAVEWFCSTPSLSDTNKDGVHECTLVTCYKPIKKNKIL